MIGFLAAILALAPAYLIRFQIFGIPTTLLEVLIAVFLFLVLLTVKYKDLNKIRALGQINLAVLMFLAAAVMSVIVSPVKLQALGQLKAYVIEPVLVFYAVIILVKNPQQIKTVLKTLFAAGVLISLFGLVQYLTFIHLPLRFWGNGLEVARIVSVFEYPNALSLYLAPLLGLFATLWLYNYPIAKNRAAAALGLFVMAVGLVLTFSRGAWIAALIGLLAACVKRFGAKKILAPALLVTVVLVLIPSVQNRLMLGVSDPSSSAHFDLLKAAWQKVLASPIFGNGLHGFSTEAGIYPHNFLLNFWLELGILGLAAFLWILFLAFKEYKKTTDKSADRQPLMIAAGIYLIIMLVHGLVDVPYFKNDLSLLFWFVIALFYAPKTN